MKVEDIIEKGAKEIPAEVLGVRMGDYRFLRYGNGGDEERWFGLDCGECHGHSESFLLDDAPLTVTKVRELPASMLRKTDVDFGPELDRSAPTILALDERRRQTVERFVLLLANNRFATLAAVLAQVFDAGVEAGRAHDGPLTEVLD